MNNEKEFWNRIEKTKNGCWEWQGTKLTSGYGVFCFNGKIKGAHRWAWIFTHGPIPKGLFVCHHCDNPPCCDPEHLFLGTPRENMADRNRKGRQATAKSHGPYCGRAKLKVSDVMEIRALPERDYQKLGMRYGVSWQTIKAICRGETWKYI